MDAELLENFPFQIDLEDLFKKMRVRETSPQGEKLSSMVAEAQAVGRPKAFFREAYVESRGDDHVVIDGTLMKSRVLRVNLDSVYRVFPYVATCGLELEGWSKSYGDILEKYYADVIKESALRLTFRRLQQVLAEKLALKLSRMNPGSLPDWPLSEQRSLFTILGDGPRSIGVQLTDSFLMMPIKSVSGIYFPSEVSWENCQMCPREKCPGRRAPHDPTLYERKFRKKEN